MAADPPAYRALVVDDALLADYLRELDRQSPIRRLMDVRGVFSRAAPTRDPDIVVDPVLGPLRHTVAPVPCPPGSPPTFRHTFTPVTDVRLIAMAPARAPAPLAVLPPDLTEPWQATADLSLAGPGGQTFQTLLDELIERTLWGAAGRPVAPPPPPRDTPQSRPYPMQMIYDPISADPFVNPPWPAPRMAPPPIPVGPPDLRPRVPTSYDRSERASARRAVFRPTDAGACLRCGCPLAGQDAVLVAPPGLPRATVHVGCLEQGDQVEPRPQS